MAKVDARPIVQLACTECKSRTYTTRKNKKNDPGRLELRKYCPRDGQYGGVREGSTCGARVGRDRSSCSCAWCKSATCTRCKRAGRWGVRRPLPFLTQLSR